MNLLLWILTALGISVAGAYLLGLRENARSDRGPESVPERVQAAAPRGAKAPAALTARYGVVPRTTSFFGPWEECQIAGQRVAFRAGSIFVGRFDADQEQLTNIYLLRSDGSTTAPSVTQLDRYLSGPAATLAQHYRLGATGAPNYPELEHVDVYSSLLKLSPAVRQVMFFEGNQGVQLEYDFSKAGSTTLDNDLHLLIRIYESAQTVK